MPSFSIDPLQVFGFADVVRSWLPWQWRPAVSSWLIWSFFLFALSVVSLALHFALREKPKLDWVFERTGLPVTLGWRMNAGVRTYVVQGLQLGGQNISGHKLHQFDAEIVLHRDQRKLPVFIAAEGAWWPLDQIEPVLPNAFMELGGSFRGDGLHWPEYPGELTPDQFLRDFGGFTYSITIDGDKRTWSFAIDELRRQIEQKMREVEEEWLKDPLNRPQVTRKKAA
jgi:hypothetical protein